MSKITIRQMADRVSGLIAERLRVKGPLPSQIPALRRRVPKEVFAAAEALSEALALSENPKLLPRIDEEAVAIAYDILLRHLNGVGRSERRMGFVLDTAARIAFALLATAILLDVVLYLRGFV